MKCQLLNIKKFFLNVLGVPSLHKFEKPCPKRFTLSVENILQEVSKQIGLKMKS